MAEPQLERRATICDRIHAITNDELEETLRLWAIAQKTPKSVQRERLQRDFEAQAQISLLFTELWSGACVEE